MIDLKQLKLELVAGRGLCPNDHSAHYDKINSDAWVGCGDKVLARRMCPTAASSDRFLTYELDLHEREVAAKIIWELIERIEKLEGNNNIRNTKRESPVDEPKAQAKNTQTWEHSTGDCSHIHPGSTHEKWAHHASDLMQGFNEGRERVSE